MISGPKFCDTPKLRHGNVDRLQSPSWDPAEHPEETEIQDCPAYELGIDNPAPTPSEFKNLDCLNDVSTAECGQSASYCYPITELYDLNGGDAWAEHCFAANRKYSEAAKKEYCDKFYAYCTYTLDFKINKQDYKRLSEDDLGLAVSGQVTPSYWSSTFSMNQPCPPVCAENEECITPGSCNDNKLPDAEVGVCTEYETCEGQTALGGFHNDLPQRNSKWVFWHHEMLNALSRVGCDCLDDFECSDKCATIASNADILMMYFLGDMVCHREVDVAGTRWDPAPNMSAMTVVFEEQWGSLGMADGESGASWYWYGASKPSWNNWDQTSMIGPGEMTFDTENECRQYAASYWGNMGYHGFKSVCAHFSSKTPGVSNAMCQAACDGNDNSFADYFSDKSYSTFFSANCIYTPYQNESDHVWSNSYVPDVNECFGQWQIGYEDQGCDGCIHSKYNNGEAFDYGWSYGPADGFEVEFPREQDEASWTGNCSAQCGKLIVEEVDSDHHYVPKDVKTAQECQNYCQEDDRCAHWVWRSTPDWTAAASIDTEGYENNNNHFNKVRTCALKSAEQVLGALATQWDTSGEWINESSPDWDGISNWEEGAPYNQYSNGQYAINDSQASQTGEGFNWYYQCSSDDQTSIRSWKWRNNMISGPKYCNASGTGRVYHGATIPASQFLAGGSTLAPCPTEAQIKDSIGTLPSVAASDAAPTEWPDLSAVESPEIPADVNPVQEMPWLDPEPAPECCDIIGYETCQMNAYEDWCSHNPGCAVTCATRVYTCYDIPGNEDCAKNAGTNSGNSCVALHARDVLMGNDANFGADQCSKEAEFDIPKTFTTSTTVAAKVTCDYTTTSTTTTTVKMEPWVPSCEEDAGSDNIARCGPPSTKAGKDFTGYEVELVESRDGKFTVDHSAGTVTMTKQPQPISWCATHPDWPELNKAMPAVDFYRAIGAVKLACAGWTAVNHDKARENSYDPNCQVEAQQVFSYENLATAVGYFPDFMGYDSKEQAQLDLAAFLANSSRETTGGWGNNLIGWAWCYVFEREMQPTHYGSQDSMPNCEGWYNVSSFERTSKNFGYYGRASIQLTWCYNYGAFMSWSNKNLGYTTTQVDFISNPELLASDDFAFAAGLWFYMSPDRDGAKPSMHSIVDYWTVTEGTMDRTTVEDLPVDSAGRRADFGYMINILNGGYECNGLVHTGPAARATYFNAYLSMMDAQIESLEAIVGLCNGCTSKPDLAKKPFEGFYDPVSQSVTPADTGRGCF
eukprot:GHVH01010798.1.p1 GENE.GHVH01010798.1~~GHVH01010798.1.p1  ORF type:complete len:1283 (-),score=197.12 GHVH01010798.1:35-3796(-)